MIEEPDISSLPVTATAKLLKVSPKTVREHIRRGLPLAAGQIDLIGVAGKTVSALMGQWAVDKALVCLFRSLKGSKPPAPAVRRVAVGPAQGRAQRRPG